LILLSYLNLSPDPAAPGKPNWSANEQREMVMVFKKTQNALRERLGGKTAGCINFEHADQELPNS